MTDWKQEIKGKLREYSPPLITQPRSNREKEILRESQEYTLEQENRTLSLAEEHFKTKRFNIAFDLSMKLAKADKQITQLKAGKEKLSQDVLDAFREGKQQSNQRIRKKLEEFIDSMFLEANYSKKSIENVMRQHFAEYLKD